MSDFTASDRAADRRTARVLITLRRVAERANRTVPGCDDASVTVVADGTLSTPAATGPSALEADRVQYRCGQGPCVDAYRRAEMVRVECLADEDRYPEFAAEALGHGVMSVLSLPLVEMLRRASHREDRSLRDVAQGVVDRNRASVTGLDGRTGR